MLYKNENPLFYWEKIEYFKYLGSLLIILLGIFLWPKIAYLSTITPEKIIELTNQERTENNLNILTANQLLTQAAYGKAKTILDSDKFQHNIKEKKFSDWIRETGYKYSYVGENLAIDFISSEAVLAAWLDSSAHKKNVLNSYYEEIGVAVVEGNFEGQNTILVVQIFGVPPLGISQPRIAGIDNQNYLIAQNYLPALNSNIGAEKFMTHSISNKLTRLNNELTSSYSYLPATEGPEQINFSGNNYVLNGVNKFFVQYNLLGLIRYFNIILSVLLLFFLTYIYFFCFSNLTKLT